MIKSWADDAWEEYLYWQAKDKDKARKINELLKSIERDGIDKGLGKPEPLKHGYKAWSRRIDLENRLVYTIVNQNDTKVIWVISCKGHYED